MDRKYKNSTKEENSGGWRKNDGRSEDCIQKCFWFIITLRSIHHENHTVKASELTRIPLKINQLFSGEMYMTKMFLRWWIFSCISHAWFLLKIYGFIWLIECCIQKCFMKKFTNFIIRSKVSIGFNCTDSFWPLTCK